jgi:hypothetical protein
MMEDPAASRNCFRQSRPFSLRKDARLIDASGNFDGFADVLPTWEVPVIRKSAALQGFHGLHAAVAAVEENAGSIGLVDEGETVAAGTQAGEVLDECALLHAEVL